jgi:translation initiation factor 2-alpha kinase 4
MLSCNTEYNDLMMHEVSLFSRLNHPNIVRYYDSWLENINRNAVSSYESDEDVYTKSKLSEIAEEYESSAVVFLPAESEPENSKSSEDDYSEEKALVKKQVDGEVSMLYIQMEYCEGATLSSYITAKQGIKCEERWRFFREILEALAYLHGRSLVHRDMKPSNIFLTKDKNIKLGDFGLAVKAFPVKQVKGNTKEEDKGWGFSSDSKEDKTESNEGKVGGGVGTPFYRSKEQENGENPIDKSDIYSLGIILFEMCYYFPTLMERSVVLTDLRKDLKFPKDFHEKVEGYKEVKKLIVQCLQDQPADRPSAIEILQR